MAGVACQALNSFQLVAGVDFHKQIPPPVPGPHVVAYCIGWAVPAPGLAALTVKAGWGNALGRQHDIGIGAYHFAANPLLPLIWLAAGNKAEFGSATVKIPTGRMAVASIPFVGINLQLDCNEPCPMPTSICLASFNTVFAGFTLADAVGGFGAMLSDIAIVFLVSKVTGVISAAAGAGFAAALGAVAGVEGLLAVGVVAAANPIAAAYVVGAVELLIGWKLGSPLGYSFKGAPGSVYGAKANDAVNDWISPAPALPPPVAGSSGTTPPGAAPSGAAPLGTSAPSPAGSPGTPPPAGSPGTPSPAGSSAEPPPAAPPVVGTPTPSDAPSEPPGSPRRPRRIR